MAISSVYAVDSSGKNEFSLLRASDNLECAIGDVALISLAINGMLNNGSEPTAADKTGIWQALWRLRDSLQKIHDDIEGQLVSDASIA